MSSFQQSIARMCGRKSKWDSLNVSLAVLMLCLRGKGNALLCQVPDLYLCYILTTTNTEYISQKSCFNKMTIWKQTINNNSSTNKQHNKNSNISTNIGDTIRWSIAVTNRQFLILKANNMNRDSQVSRGEQMPVMVSFWRQWSCG